MPVGLFRFPFVVYDLVVKHMELPETIALTTTSKKSHAKVRTCLACQKLLLNYKVNKSFELKRRHSDGMVKETMRVELWHQMGLNLVQHCQFWNFLARVRVPVEIIKKSNSRSRMLIFFPEPSAMCSTMLKFIINLFPKLIFSFEYYPSTLVDFESLSEISDDVELYKVKVGRNDRQMANRLVQCALQFCQNAKVLILLPKTTDEFKLAQDTHTPFAFDHLHLYMPRWVTKDHFIKLFLTCKSVVLEEKEFEDEDLKAIFEKWVEDSPMDYLRISGSGTFYHQKTLTNIVGHFPGAEAVKKARIGYCDPEPDVKHTVQEFREGKCYQIQQRSGKKALVHQKMNAVYLSIAFQIGEEVNKMPVGSDEEEVDEEEEEEEELEEDEEDV